MKILLIRCNERLHPMIPETNVTGVYAPLGLAYIAAVLKKAQYDVHVLDAHALNLSWNEYSKYISSHKSDIALFTSTTLTWPNIVKAAQIIKSLFPDTYIGIGGPQLSVYPKESLSFDCIDFGVYGEGEETILEVLSKFNGTKKADNIKGTIIKKGKEIIVNSPREYTEDLDKIPFLAWDLLPVKSYRSLSVNYPFYSMITSRGCPFTCRFCSQIYSGNKLRFRSAENVTEEMDLYVNKYYAKELILFDETFTVDKQRVMAICSLIDKKKLKFKWNIRTRVDTIDREMLLALKNAGCSGVHMGVESGSQRILDSMEKNITLDKIKDSFKTAKALGFVTRGYFMIGYPGETLSEIMQTINFSKELGLDLASFTITIPNPATKIYNDALKNGVLENDYWKEYTLLKTTKPVSFFVSQEYDKNKLMKLKNLAYIKFYMRLNIIFKMLFKKETFFNIPLILRLFIKNHD